MTGYPLDPLGRNNCVGWNAFARDWPGPTNGFDAVVPLEARYDPVTNRGGARGTLQDGSVSSLGINPATGFARQPYDNVGVQYGLAALNNGDITKEEFLHLNEKVGGLDIDGNFVARAQRRRPEGHRARLPLRARQRRREPHVADHPVPQLRRLRERHPFVPPQRARCSSA